MFTLKYLLSFLFNPHTCIWVDVLLIKETPRAILIEFDGRKIWLPKAWILRVRRGKDDKAIKIKISEYHWAKKAQ